MVIFLFSALGLVQYLRTTGCSTSNLIIAIATQGWFSAASLMLQKIPASFGYSITSHRGSAKLILYSVSSYQCLSTDRLALSCYVNVLWIQKGSERGFTRKTSILHPLITEWIEVLKCSLLPVMAVAWCVFSSIVEFGSSKVKSSQSQLICKVCFGCLYFLCVCHN